MTEKQTKRLFGTNGVRGVIGDTMTPQLAMKIGMALASERGPVIALGRDTRTSGPAISSAVCAGLLACGADVVDLGILPTPALQFIVKNHFDAGAVVTASHNPPEYNGVKIIESDGTEMDDDSVIVLEERIFNDNFHIRTWDDVGSSWSAPEMLREYCVAVVGAFPGLHAGNMTVAVDPGSGPACVTTPDILSHLGCRVHTINGTMDGTFPGRLPEPSPEGLSALSQLVQDTGAAFGVAHDGDADRAVFIDEKGNFVEENEEFALMQRFICSKHPGGTVVTPVSTSFLVEKVAAETNSRVVYTEVGSIYVARKMLGLAAEGVDIIFGGEGNGGIIFPFHQHCRDGGMTAAAMVALLTTEGKPLSELVASLPPHFMIKEKLHTNNARRVLDHARKAFSGDTIDETDGIRINRKDRWALLRPSGTEPFMRLYVEAGDETGAQKFADEIMAAITPAL